MSGVADRLLVVGKFAVTPTGLTVEGQPTFEEWRDRGDVLHLTEAGLPWAIGDWWAVGEHKYGDRASRAVDPTTGADRLQRFMNYAWVSKKFETSRRREVLSWSHHEAVAALDPHEQDRLLDEAVRHNWSVHDLRVAIREDRTQTEEPHDRSKEADHRSKEGGPGPITPTLGRRKPIIGPRRPAIARGATRNFPLIVLATTPGVGR